MTASRPVRPLRRRARSPAPRAPARWRWRFRSAQPKPSRPSPSTPTRWCAWPPLSSFPPSGRATATSDRPPTTRSSLCSIEPAGDFGTSSPVAGHLMIPKQSTGIVVFAHGSGSSRHSPRNRYVADVLNETGLATVLFDLLTPAEERNRANVFDIELLAHRL